MQNADESLIIDYTFTGNIKNYTTREGSFAHTYSTCTHTPPMRTNLSVVRSTLLLKHTPALAALSPPGRAELLGTQFCL